MMIIQIQRIVQVKDSDSQPQRNSGRIVRRTREEWTRQLFPKELPDFNATNCSDRDTANAIRAINTQRSDIRRETKTT